MNTSTKQLAENLALLVLIFLWSTNINGIYAQGPNAPEASSFEPVDATDMVSLNTGSLTYVLPLLNVPSPEGGYPIALSYHAGIAMDQEASWVGLGWNINPGAINRSLNGYPDDWKDGRFKEYFYDQGGQNSYIGQNIGFMSYSGASVGLLLSYSDDKGFGGDVSFGVGLDGFSVEASAGTSGASLGVSVGVGNGFSVGASIGTNGVGLHVGGNGISFSVDSYGVGISAGSNRGRIGIRSSWDGDVSVNANVSSKMSSVGISFSSKGLNVSASILGFNIGANNGLENSVSQSDYNIDKSGFFIPIYIPTYYGVVDLSVRYQKIEYDLDKLKTAAVNGPLYYKNSDNKTFRWECSYKFDPQGPSFEHHVDPGHIHQDVNLYTYNVYTVNDVDSFDDIHEVDFRDASLKLDRNNAIFPSYDNFRVTAQGLSGTMRPIVYKNGSLIGLRKEIETDGSGDGSFEINYEYQTNSNTSFNIKPEFHFDSEYSSSLLIESATFDHTTVATNIFDYINFLPSTEVTRKKGGRYVESFTNAELASSGAYATGLIKANSTINYGDNIQFDQDGIGAFKVTTADGKTYHYALPVYNHETVFRQYGMVKDEFDNPKGENEAFFEKRQLKKYATHWLLTAITGPDFVDMNNNSLADDGDYGYWASFDYGKWSDGFIWYTPYGEEYEVSTDNEDIKYYSWGRKEIYYLDKIKTRTHTALFVKEPRKDGQGKQLYYNHRLNNDTDPIVNHYLPQSLLRLREIILLKNTDAVGVSKVNLSAIDVIPSPSYTQNITFFDKVYEAGGTKTVSYSMQNNILDTKDIQVINNLREKAVKIVDFTGYSYKLAQGAPFTYDGVGGRLTLDHVTFKGKGGVQLQPSYNFSYYEGAYNKDHKDKWGYNKFSAKAWNLREIKMPTGGKIQIEYEPNSFVSSFEDDSTFPASFPIANEVEITHYEPFSVFGINTGSKLPVSVSWLSNCYDHQNGEPIPNGMIRYNWTSYNGLGTVTQILDGGKKLKITLDDGVTFHEDSAAGPTTCDEFTNNYVNFSRVTIPQEIHYTGTRVKSITTTDGVVSYKKEYNYNIPGSNFTSGIVSYVPFINLVNEKVSYGSELPPPIPMYGNVKVTSYGNDNSTQGYTAYQFNTLPQKAGGSTNVGYPEILEVSTYKRAAENPPTGYGVLMGNIHLKENLASLGRLISQSTYNNYGQLLNKSINNYKSIEDIDQGITQESYLTHKVIDYEINNIGKDRWLVSNTTRTRYPSVLESTTVIQGGFSSTTYFDKHDNISAQLLETRTVGSDGTEFKTEVVPAYTKYAAMGSKADNALNKNMLTQEAMTKSYINQSGSWVETGVGLSTWQPYNYSYNGGNTDVWRKHKTYTWDGETDANGLFVNYTDEDDGFNWSLTASSQPNQWKQLSEITKYDEFSMVLEIADINGNYAATKNGDANTKIMATANSGYNEMFYSGAEYLDGTTFDDGIASTGQTDVRAHTGKYSIAIGAEQGFRTDISGQRAGKYKISVWASKDNYQNARVYDGLGVQTFNGESIPAGDWVLLNHYVDWNTSSKTVYVTSNTGTTYFDDFRIHPIQSSMTSYVYNEWDELEATLSTNNLFTRYEYDAIGRLIKTYTEVVDDVGVTGGAKKIAEHKYQFSNTIEGVIEPLTVSVTYGNSGTTFQEFVAVVSGGSGNYQFRWYKGVGDSSAIFEPTWSGSSANFTWSNISGCINHYVKLVVTDLEYGYLDPSVRIIKNNNECDPNYSEPTN